MNYDESEYFSSPSLETGKFESEEEFQRGSEYVEKRLWEKVERVGSRIRFANEVKALYRYMIDRYVPWYRKTIVIAALIYFISPIDTIPDIAPFVGYLDDFGVIMAVIKFLGKELTPYYG